MLSQVSHSVSIGTLLQARKGSGGQSKEVNGLAFFRRLLWYSGVGMLAASVGALAIRLWAPESLHLALFRLLHSLSTGWCYWRCSVPLARLESEATLHNCSRGCRQKSLLQTITARSWQMAKYDVVLLA